jgi:molybdopterin molybdotransferase
MTSVEEALQAVTAAAVRRSVPVETVPLADALDRVLAEDVAMDHDVPPFRRATMDGFAARRADVVPGARLEVAGRVVAGDAPGARCPAGACVRVTTGAPMPDGAERVVPVEWADEAEGRVAIRTLATDDPFVVQRGAHRAEGAVVLARGRRLGAGDLGVLASAGRARVRVAVRPRVAVLGTGSELVDVGATPGPGQIRNSNGAALLAQVRGAGAAPVDLGLAPDEMEALAGRIRKGLEADVLLLSGGVSRGDLDLVPAALQREGVERRFHRWAVQPGGPLWFGVRGPTLVFGLPGNPAASFVGFEVLVERALRLLLGSAERRTVRARFDGPFGDPSPRRRYRPVRLSSEGAVQVATAIPWLGSGDPFALSEAEGLAVLPEERPAPADRVVDVLLLGGLR